MMNYIRNLAIFPRVKSRLSSNLKMQQKFIRASLLNEINESKKTNDTSLDEHDFKKMTDYYGLAVPVMIGESFCKLRGRKMSSKERFDLTYLGGLTGLFDDFFDKKDLPENYIRELLEQPQKMVGKDSNEKLILRLYLKVLESSSHPDQLTRFSLDVYNAQVLSKKQLYSELSRKEIEDITFQKGGCSVLFYRCTFAEEMSDSEKELFYKLGGIWQIENDLLDIYKDCKAGIKTLVTTEDKINNLRQKYIRHINELVRLLLQTEYSISNKRQFLDSIGLFLSVGFVTLNVLEKNEKKTQHIFLPEKYDRKDLICDLEKPVNILKIIHYFAKYNPALSIK